MEWTLSKDISSKIPKDQKDKITLGIRPEHLIPQTEKKNDFPAFNAFTELIEPMGNELFVHLSASDIRLTMRCQPDLNIKEGENIHLTFNPQNVHFFNSETGDII